MSDLRGHLVTTTHVFDFPPPYRHPLVMILSAAAAVQGVVLLAGGPVPGSVEQVLSHGLLVVWALGLVAVGVGFLTAAVWRDALTGALIEVATCAVGVLAIGGYTAGAIGVLGHKVLQLTVLQVIAYGVALLVEGILSVRRIRRAQRRMHGKPVIEATR